MNFMDFVREQIGPRPSFSHGHYSLEARTWDAKYVQLLNGGIEETAPIYHPRRRATEAKERANEAA